METPTTATPSHRPHSLSHSHSHSPSHRRALTVNLMELLDNSGGVNDHNNNNNNNNNNENDNGNGNGPIHRDSRGTAVNYAVFDPEQLWQAAAPADDGMLPVSTEAVSAGGVGGVRDTNNKISEMNICVNGSGASSQCVLIVFGTSPLKEKELRLRYETSTSSDGSVMHFLISKTDFMDHLLSSSIAVPSATCDCKEETMKNDETNDKKEKNGLAVKEDGHKEVLLFTDVNMEGPDEIRTISVVYVHLTREECQVTNREAAQWRASQVINTIQTLFFDSSETMFWVDFTGILDFVRTEVQKELRDAWWSLIITSASSSDNNSNLRLTALVNSTAIPRLRKEFEHIVKEEEEEEVVTPRSCTFHTNLGEEILSVRLSGATPLIRYCTEDNADVSSLRDIGLSNGEREKSNNSEDELLWMKYANILNCHTTEKNPETCTDEEASVTDKDDDDDSYDDDDCELIWERHLRVVAEDGNDKVVKVFPSPPSPPPHSRAAAAAEDRTVKVKIKKENDENEFIWERHVGDLNMSVKETPLHNISKGVSSLILQYSSETNLSSSLSTDVSIRELLVSWSALGIEHSPRIIIVIADSDYGFEDALLSWVRTPCAQNALILPIFVVSELDIHSSMENIERESLPSIPISHKYKKPLTSCEFLRVLTFAIEYFGIDVHSSACLTVNHPFLQVADQLGFQAVGDYQYIFSWVTQMNGNEASELSIIQKMLDVEAAREWAFLNLCHTNTLAQTLRESPRRPEVLMQRVNNMRVGITRPVICDAVALVSTIPMETRLSGSPNAIRLLLTETQLSSVYHFMMSFFTRDVFAIAVDIVRSHNSDYFSSHHFATVGYFRYELTSWVRRHVLVSLHINFQPFLAAELMPTPPHWSRVIRQMSCTCTPRRHEKTFYTETGEKKCRHMAQLLYWFLQRCAVTSLGVNADESPFVRSTTRQQKQQQQQRLRGDRLAPLMKSTVEKNKEEEREEEEEKERVNNNKKTTRTTEMAKMKRNRNKKMRMDEGDYGSLPLQVVSTTGSRKDASQTGEEKVQHPNVDGDVSLLEFAALLGIT